MSKKAQAQAQAQEVVVAETVENTGMVLFGEKAELPAYDAADAGAGNENVGAEDRALPQIKLLQAISPEIHEVPGARQGLFFNTLTRELMDSILVVNLKFTKVYTVWKSRDLGGGKMGDYDSEADAQTALANLPGKKEDYAINETAVHMILLMDPTTHQLTSPAIMYMDRSKLGASRAWNTSISLSGEGKAPRFASVWKMDAEGVKNKRNEHYYNLKITQHGWLPPSGPLFKIAKDSYEALSRGQVA